MRRAWIKSGACAVIVLMPWVASAEPDYAVRWFTVDSGGAISSGNGYTVRGSAGQPDAAGESAQPPFVVTGGFWVAGATARPGGALPNGGSLPGGPLRLAKAAAGAITLSWSASCLTDDLDFAVQEGELGAFASHVPAGNPSCTTSGATSTTIAPAAGDRYYLVVPLGDVREGSYGTDSDGVERPPSTVPCLPQWIGPCPTT